VTWCWHQIDSSDVEYVRADIAAAPTSPPIYQVQRGMLDEAWYAVEKDVWDRTDSKWRRIVVEVVAPAVREEA
jgi:hypothetical protein